MGYFLIILTALSILVNILIFLKKAIHNLKLIFIKVYNYIRAVIRGKPKKKPFPVDIPFRD